MYYCVGLYLSNEKDLKMVDFEKSTLQLALPTPTKLFTPFDTTALVLMIIGYAVASYAKVFTAEQLCLTASGIFRF